MDIITKNRTQSESFIKLRNKSVDYFESISVNQSSVYKYTWMQPNAKQHNDIKTMVEDETLKPIVDHIYSFEDGIDAYEYLATGRAK